MRQKKNAVAVSRSPSLQARRRTGVLEMTYRCRSGQHLRAKTRTLLLWVNQGKVKGYALSGTERHCGAF
jgi:hypothetical protein